MGKAYLIASGKGGTGKSMFAVNYASTLAKSGAKVVILDLDLGLRNLDLYFGLENNVVYDVYDVLTGVCRIKQALIRDKRIFGSVSDGSFSFQRRRLSDAAAYEDSL